MLPKLLEKYLTWAKEVQILQTDGGREQGGILIP